MTVKELDRQKAIEYWSLTCSVDVMKGTPEVWDGSGDTAILYRDDLYLSDGETPKPDVMQIDIDMMSHPKFADWVDYQLYPEYRSEASPETAGKWWWNLDKLVKGEYPWEQIPDYLKPAAQKFYNKS
jgi:hypothetical protein